MNDRSTLLLEHHLKELKLPSFLREYGKMAAQCAEGMDHPQYLLRLAELELIDCHYPMVERRIRAARFPAIQSLYTFDFTAIPSVNKGLVMELAHCEYIQGQENVIAKTLVALGLGLTSCQRGMSVGFTTAVVHLIAALDTTGPATSWSSASLAPLFLVVRQHALRTLDALTEAILKHVVSFAFFDMSCDCQADHLRDRLTLDGRDRVQFLCLVGRQANGHRFERFHTSHCPF